MDENTRKALLQLTEQWRRDAAQRFKCAKSETNPMGKKLIEHGGVCLFNCIMDVRRMLGLGLPGSEPGDLPLEVVTKNSKSP